MTCYCNALFNEFIQLEVEKLNFFEVMDAFSVEQKMGKTKLLSLLSIFVQIIRHFIFFEVTNPKKC